MTSISNDADVARTPRDVTSELAGRALASRRLGFSVTQACPLRCAHCSVSASPDLKSTTFPDSFTNQAVDEMPALAGIGITCIDFTGGEPTLAADFVGRVSEAAACHGVSAGIVTAAHWATTDALGRRFLQRFPHVNHWDISTDIYHLPFVPVDRIRRAFDLLAESGRMPMLRIAHHEPLSYEEAVLIDRVHRFAGTRMSFQPIGPVGRAEGLVTAMPATLSTHDRSPCPTTGPLVQPSGGVSPCCAPLSHESNEHPLRQGHAFPGRLVDAVMRWRRDPLLQTIRLWGFEPVVEWLREVPRLQAALRGRACDTCVAMARQGDLLTHAARRAGRLEHRILVAQALKTWFDEPWMEQALLEEAREYMAGQVVVDA